MIKRIYHVSIVAVSICALCIAVDAQGQEGRRTIKSTAEEFMGTISGISVNSISLVYKEDKEKGVEYEIILPIDNNVKLLHKRNLKELNVGDMVAILFEEKVTEDPKGEKRVERKTKQISFVRAAEKKQQTSGPPEPGEGVPDDI